MDWFIVSIAAVGAGDVLVAGAAWRLFSKATPRPRLAGTIGAILGGVAGALVAEPQVAEVTHQLGYIEEAAGMKILFAFSFLVPLTTGVTAWLLSELLGGRSDRRFRQLILGVLGAALGAGLVFIPAFFMSPAPAWISYPILVSVPAVIAALAVDLSARWSCRPTRRCSGRGFAPPLNGSIVGQTSDDETERARAHSPILQPRHCRHHASESGRRLVRG